MWASVSYCMLKCKYRFRLWSLIIIVDIVYMQCRFFYSPLKKISDFFVKFQPDCAPELALFVEILKHFFEKNEVDIGVLLTLLKENSQYSSYISLILYTWSLSQPEPTRSEMIKIAQSHCKFAFDEWGFMNNLQADDFSQLKPKFDPMKHGLFTKVTEACKDLFSETILLYFIGMWYGDFYQDQGKYKDALSMYTQALTTAQKYYGEHSLQVAMCYAQLAVVTRLEGRVEDADIFIQFSTEICRTDFEGQQDAFSLTERLAWIYYSEKRYQEAKMICLAILNLKVDYDGLLLEKQHYCRKLLVQAHYLLDELVECEAILLEMLESSTLLLKERGLEVANTYFNLGVMCHRTGRLKEAFELYEVSKVMRNELNSKQLF